MEVVSQVVIRPQNKPINVLSNKGILRKEERQGTQMYELQTRTPPQTQSPNTVLTRRLSDYKVQELKNECKKRQLPVSVQCPPISSAVHHHAIQEQLRSSQVTINDYLQSQNRPVVLHLPSATPQLVQLVDVKGAVLGMATLQYQGAVETNQQQTVLPQQSRTMAHQISSVGQDTIPALAHSSVGSGPVTSLSQPKIVQATHILQKPNENTFRFAQMGSGGQVSNIMYKKCTEPPSSIHVPSATPTSSTSLMVAFQSTPTKTTNFQHQENAQAQNVSEERLRSPSLQDSPRTADQAGSSPNMPHGGGTNQGDETCLDPMNGMETGNETDENHITLDPSDPSSVLTPATLSMHEDMLRSHQKKIEGLLKELSKSQIQLKQQQQLILTAKKAQATYRRVGVILQQRLREQQRDINEHSRADRDQWLRELDIRQHNKQHIQQFLQHRKQQITLQVYFGCFKSILHLFKYIILATIEFTTILRTIIATKPIEL
uniref:Histone deacetylase n=1 Tax=Heterorhabditis bacteriophora TaxID=37862 RepID=A0A1I7WH17_HETBA